MKEMIEKIISNKNNKKELVELFRKNKYEYPFHTIIILYFLRNFIKNKDEIYYHLFNHFLLLSLPDEVISSLKEFYSEKEFLKDIIKDYPLTIKDNEFEKILLNNDFQDIAIYIKNYFYKYKRNEISKSYYKLADMFFIINNNLSEKYYKKSIQFANEILKPKIILNYINLLIKENEVNKAINNLKLYVNEVSKNSSVSLLYKLGSIYEDIDKNIALKYYKEIYNIKNDYLDIEEKLIQLTGNKKRYKINNYENNIHFF